MGVPVQIKMGPGQGKFQPVSSPEYQSKSPSKQRHLPWIQGGTADD